MKAVVYDAPRQYAVKEIPVPEAGPGEVRIKVDQVGVCGTDLHIHHGDFNAVFPLTPGHELVGTVDALGDGVTGFHVGEQVTVNPNIYCGKCDYCLAGRLIQCSDMKGLGSNYPGFFAEYVTVERGPGLLASRASTRTPPSSPSRPPAPCTAWSRSRCDPGATALVFGAGPTGLLLAQLIKSGGAASVTVAAPTAVQARDGRGAGHRPHGPHRPGGHGGQPRDAPRGLRRGRLRLRRRGDRLDGDRQHLRAADPQRRHRPGLRRHASRRDRELPPVRRLPPRDHHQGLLRRDDLVRRGDPRSAIGPGQDRRHHHAPVLAGRTTARPSTPSRTTARPTRSSSSPRPEQRRRSTPTRRRR